MLAAITDTKTQQQIRDKHVSATVIYRDTRSSRTGELRHDGELVIHPEKHQQTAELSELLAATGRVTRPRETPTKPTPRETPTNCRTQRTTRCYWQSYTTQRNTNKTNTQRNTNKLPNSANYSLLLAELHDPEKQQQTAELSELLAATGRVTRPRETATDCRTQRESLDELLAATGRVTHPEKQ